MYMEQTNALRVFTHGTQIPVLSCRAKLGHSGEANTKRAKSRNRGCSVNNISSVSGAHRTKSRHCRPPFRMMKTSFTLTAGQADMRMGEPPCRRPRVHIGICAVAAHKVFGKGLGKELHLLLAPAVFCPVY